MSQNDMVKEKKGPMLSEVAGRLMALFTGNDRSTGRFNPANQKALTEDRAPTIADFMEHIKGTMGVGIVPICDDATCRWAALDIDNHGDDADVPIIPVEDKVNALGLPLVLCRSKSGGIHGYLFLKEPMGAAKVRNLLGEWATKLGFPGCEVFPKQNKLHRQASGGLSLGNWINLPYMGGKETVRYAVHNGQKIGLIEFLDLAEERKTSDAELKKLITLQYMDAPPCIVKLLAKGVAEGNRNEALFSTTVFLRKAFPDDFKRRAEELNATIFAKPLSKTELARTVMSAGRPDYSYRCNEEPMRSFCDKTACIASKFGITIKDADGLDQIQNLPTFSDLVKYTTEPVRWEITIGDKKVGNLSTSQLLEWRVMRELVAERLMKVVPMIKAVEWERILSPLMDGVRLVDTPDDASVAGIVRVRLKEFAAKTDLMSKGTDIRERAALLRGMPVVQEIEGERCVVFRGQDFISYLKRTKSEELKGVNLWFALKDSGVAHIKMRVNDHSINVWRIPVDLITRGWAEAEAPIFTSEI